MNNDLKTLFYPFEQGHLSEKNFTKTLFLNARKHEKMKKFPSILSLQFFKPYADELSNSGYKIDTNIEALNQKNDLILILAPKNIIEAKGLIARAATLLNYDGVIICAADNKAGGTRLKQIFVDFSFNIIGEESKNKARVIWAKTNTNNAKIISQAITATSEQFLESIKFHSIPGIFGWDKIDQGSSLLLSCLPDTLSGVGADFGCGYGYLSQSLLNRYKNIKMLHCIDADYRALDMCKKNCSEYKENCNFLWEDLLQPHLTLKNLDFIIMNPPFHEGKTEDINIGQMFIVNASKALRKKGYLYMVANKHLPYEEILKNHFSNVKAMDQKNGFKTFIACL